MQPDKDWLKASLGPNAEYYLARFAEIDARGPWRPTWHWPAFFVSAPWFLYRGMSGYAFIDSIVFWVAFYYALNRRDPDAPFIALAVASVLFVVVPAYANALYYRLMKKRFARAQAKPDHPLSKFKPTSSIAGAVVGATLIMGFTLVLSVMVWTQGMHADYTLRSRMSEVVNVAGVCKTSVAEFYQSKNRMPASAKEAGCPETPWENVGAPRVDGGVIRVEASGRTRKMLEDAQSGIEFRYTPVCEGGRCDGKPITGWDCKTGTTVRPMYVPAVCR